MGNSVVNNDSHLAKVAARIIKWLRDLPVDPECWPKWLGETIKVAEPLFHFLRVPMIYLYLNSLSSEVTSNLDS